MTSSSRGRHSVTPGWPRRRKILYLCRELGDDLKWHGKLLFQFILFTLLLALVEAGPFLFETAPEWARDFVRGKAWSFDFMYALAVISILPISAVKQFFRPAKRGSKPDQPFPGGFEELLLTLVPINLVFSAAMGFGALKILTFLPVYVQQAQTSVQRGWGFSPFPTLSEGALIWTYVILLALMDCVGWARKFLRVVKSLCKRRWPDSARDRRKDGIRYEFVPSRLGVADTVEFRADLRCFLKSVNLEKVDIGPMSVSGRGNGGGTGEPDIASGVVDARLGGNTVKAVVHVDPENKLRLDRRYRLRARRWATIRKYSCVLYRCPGLDSEKGEIKRGSSGSEPDRWVFRFYPHDQAVKLCSQRRKCYTVAALVDPSYKDYRS